MGAFHNTKNPKISFEREKERTVSGGSVRLECSGAPLEAFQFDQSKRNLPFHFGKPILALYFSSEDFRSHLALVTDRRIKGKEYDNSHSSWLHWPGLIGKCHSFFLAQVIPTGLWPINLEQWQAPLSFREKSTDLGREETYQE